MSEYIPYERRKDVEFASLAGLTFSNVTAKDDEIEFITSDGRRFLMSHSQDCCESVSIESITGDIADLIGEPILRAEASTSSDQNPPGVPVPEYQDSFTWTFYKLATRKGYVDIRWYGESNGWYSEGVDLIEVLPEPAA